MLFTDLPYAPPRQAPVPIPPEARGAIGARAALYGVGSKQDGDDLAPMPPPDDSVLRPVPPPDPTWPATEVEIVAAASERAAAIGEVRLANLWRRNLGRPKSAYADVPALQRMLATMERAHAGRAQALTPVEPDVVHESLATIPLAGAAYPWTVVPQPLARSVVAFVNARVAEIARAGFGNPAQVHAGNASLEVLEVKNALSRARGATVRVINQIGHLQSASRLGQTPVNPMTLGRRRGLVASALAQLAEDICAGPWTPESLGLITDEARARWAEREATTPLRPAHHRDLFAWSERDRPDPAFLDSGELERLIQSHPDLGYVERLRRERATRLAPAPAY